MFVVFSKFFFIEENHFVTFLLSNSGVVDPDVVGSVVTEGLSVLGGIVMGGIVLGDDDLLEEDLLEDESLEVDCAVVDWIMGE